MSSAAEFSWDEMVPLDDLVVSGEVLLGRGNVISKIDIRNNPGPYPIYSSSSKNCGKMGEYGSFMFDEELISWSVDGGGYFFHRPKHKFSVTNVSGYMRLSPEWDYRFTAYSLQFQHEYFSFDYQTKAHPSVIREFYLFPKVPLPEQQKIAAILSSVDNVIEKTRAQIDKLRDLKTGMMQELLTKGIGHTEFKDSPVGRIPAGWDVKPLSEVCAIIRDGTHLPPKRVAVGVPLLSVRNMQNGRFSLLDDDTFVTWEFYEKMHAKWKPESGDLLLAVVGATVGKVCQVPVNFPKFTLQRSVAVLRGKDSVLDNDFLYVYAQSKMFNDSLWDRVNQTAQPGIYLAEIGKLLVPIPPVSEQAAISEKFQSVQLVINERARKLEKISELKKSLMQDLLTGKVRVKTNNNNSEDRVAV